MIGALAILPDQLPFEFDLDEDEPRERYAGTMRYVVSVSQLKMFAPSAKGCPRKWAFHYPWMFPREMTIPLRDGIRLHRAIKDHCHGLPDGAAWASKWKPEGPTGALALAMMRRVPDLAKWESEPTFFLEVPELDTAIYIKPDLMSYGACGEIEAFKDWKSTSAMHKRSPWVLQDRAWWPNGVLPEPANGDTWFTLENDIQFRIYSHGLMTLFGGDEIEGEWIYGCKKFSDGQIPTTWSLKATARRAETKDWCETYVWPLIRTMNAIREGAASGQIDTPLLVPADPYSCQHKGHFCLDLLGHCALYVSPVSLDCLHLPVIPA